MLKNKKNNKPQKWYQRIEYWAALISIIAGLIAILQYISTNNDYQKSNKKHSENPSTKFSVEK